MTSSAVSAAASADAGRRPLTAPCFVTVTDHHESASRRLTSSPLSLSDAATARDVSGTSGYGSESGDMLREMVKNKDVMIARSGGRGGLQKYSSMESDVSDGSTLVRAQSARAHAPSHHR